MIRLQFLIVSIGLWFFPMLDATIKGTVVLLLAGGVCLILRQDSAATRHLVWATAVMLLLAMPLLSVLLPQWRVLPNWTKTSATVASTNSPNPQFQFSTPFPEGATRPVEIPGDAPEEPSVVVTAKMTVPASEGASPLPADTTDVKQAPGVVATMTEQPAALLMMVWLVGCVLVLLRLCLAVLFLRKSANRCQLVSPISENSTSRTNDGRRGERELRSALDIAAMQMGVKRSVQHLLDPRQSMPVVWGLFRVRLRLPAEATEWTAERQQSVLLHELAHIRRNDLLVLAMTQFACALNWFNPLMWVAAWRLHVERERACDDLVLSTGIRPSTYAEHLVEVVSRLRSAAWLQSCGLAMARKSSLESRLRAVLSGRINRRGLTRFLVAAVLLVGAGIAIPVAMLHAADESAQEKPAAADEPVDQALPEPKQSVKLAPGVEEKLQWGEPTNGLRAALVRPQALGQPAVQEIFDFRFVVQNVSDAPIRLSTASVAPTRRYLILREHGRPLSAMHDQEPTRADFLIQPREVAVLRMFSNSTKGDPIAVGPSELTFSAEFNIEKAPEGSWNGKLAAAEMQAAAAGYGLLPKNKAARELFIIWNACARRNEKIPGGMIGLLAESVKTFTGYNPTSKTTPQLLEMLPRLDATRDWTGQEAIALLDELATLQDTAVKMAVEHEDISKIYTGTPLPPEMVNAPWGRVHLSGLRLAWLLEPQEKQHHLNTPLKSRILIYNVSSSAVVFRTRNWHQVGHTATDTNGDEIKTESTSWTTEARFLAYRLAPGEYVELYAPGIGVGANKDYEDWQNSRVGTWIDVKAGDEVTVTTAAIPFYDWREKPESDHESGWWLGLIRSRLARFEPLPDDAKERELLLYRVAMELFRNPVSKDINESFVNDHEPTALDSLAKRLLDRPKTTTFTGSLVSGPTKFKVLPVDPEVAKRPRTAHNPGRYTLGNQIVLAVSRTRVDERIVNKASINFYPTESNQPAPGEPYELKLPHGYGTWAVAWMRGGTTLWIQDKNGHRKVDFSNPAKVQEETVESDRVPDDIRSALQAILAAAAERGSGKQSPPPVAAEVP